MDTRKRKEGIIMYNTVYDAMNDAIDRDPSDYGFEPDDHITADHILWLQSCKEIMSVYMDASGEEADKAVYQDIIDRLDDRAEAVMAALASVVADQGYDYCPYVYGGFPYGSASETYY